DDGRSSLRADRRERGDDLALDAVVVEAEDERARVLDVLRPDLEDRFEPRVARAGVVDRDGEAGGTQELQHLPEGGVAPHDLLLGDLENDRRMRPADLGEVPFVQEDRVREKARRGVDEEGSSPDRRPDTPEDRLEAETLELERHVAQAGRVEER